jgi:hypothetical protein
MHNLSQLISNVMFSFNVNTGLFSIDPLDQNGSEFILDLSDDEDLAEFDNLCDLFIDKKVKHTKLESVDGTLFFDVNIAGDIVITHIAGQPDSLKESVFTIGGYDLLDACTILDKISRIM